jgi:hypothetical protein
MQFFTIGVRNDSNVAGSTILLSRYAWLQQQLQTPSPSISSVMQFSTVGVRKKIGNPTYHSHFSHELKPLILKNKIYFHLTYFSHCMLGYTEESWQSELIQALKLQTNKWNCLMVALSLKDSLFLNPSFDCCIYRTIRGMHATIWTW